MTPCRSERGRGTVGTLDIRARMSNEVVPVPIWRGLVPAHPADRQAKPPESGAGMIFGDAADRPQLTLRYNRDLYVFDDSVATRRLRGAKALVSEAEDGSVTIRANGHVVAGRLD